MGRLSSFEGKAAIVNGASSGIGRALALQLAERGARVALLARRKDALDALAEEIRSLGGWALAVTCDVGDREEVFASFRTAEETMGPADLLINNAGYGGHRWFLEWDLDDVERMMRVNFLGAVHCTRAVLDSMVRRGSGWIVFMASVAGKIAPPRESVYAASKFAMVGLASALSLEVEHAGVHVLTVCPGAVGTPFFGDGDLDELPPVARRRMVAPEELAGAVLGALQRGRRELTYPRWMAVAYAVQALAPGFTRRQVGRTVLGRKGGE